MDKRKKIMGCLLGAAVGDALGAVTECRTQEQIKNDFGGFVQDFHTPPMDTFAQGNAAGMITDDFWQGYYILESALELGGRISVDTVKDGLLKWTKNPWYENFTGPTTRMAMANLFGDQRKSFQGELEAKESLKKDINPIINDGNSKATNGAAMKIFPAALLAPFGDLNAAINNAITMASLTHNNNLSFAGAAAVAASISLALAGDAGIIEVIQAGVYGAKKGDEIGKKRGLAVAGPSVSRRIQLAVSLGIQHTGWQEAIVDIAELIGSGLHVSEAVPAVYGIIASASASPWEAILGGVNVGNDTDTIATMIGAIVGAQNGVDSFPSHCLPMIDKMNDIDLDRMADLLLARTLTK